MTVLPRSSRSWRRRASRDGSILLTTVVLGAIIGVVLLSSLNLVNSQNRSVVRSQAWNICIPVLEAGIEEAMAHLNNSKETSLAVNDWAASGSDYYRSRTMGENFYNVRISPSNAFFATIYCTGYVRAPLVLGSVSGPLLASSIDVGGIRYLARAVRVEALRRGVFAKAMVARERIDMNGNSIETDSFDSSNPDYSTPEGLYDPSKARDHGDVCTTSGGTNIINVGNANIKGHVRTGPGGTAGWNANGVIGSMAWHLGGNKGAEDGWISDDMNITFPSVTRPPSFGSTAPVSGTVTGRVYKYLLTGGTNVISTLNISSKEKMGVTNRTVLIVDGDVDIKGGIEIFPGGSLELYVGGANAIIGGDGVNFVGRATNFTYYGLPTNKRLSLPSNGDFTGAIYAPDADLRLSGGGGADLNFSGSCVMRSIVVNGHYRFHYDESLGQYGPIKNYTIISWVEL